MRFRRTWRAAVAVGAALGMALMMAAPANADQAAAGTVSPPVVEGLIGPLGLSVTDNGTIYVAEAFAGQLTRVLPNGNRSVLFASPGNSVEGVAASVYGRVAVTVTIPGADPMGGALDSLVVGVQPNGDSAPLASTFEYEVAHNTDANTSYGFVDAPADCLAQLPPELQPYTGIVDSHAYSIAALNPYTFAIADAASNSILRLAGNRLTTVAVLPAIPQRFPVSTAEKIGLPCLGGQLWYSEPVPTDIEVGPDGYWYVSALPGAPELPGYGSVYRINPDTGSVRLVARGFAGAVDLAIAADRTIYVAEISGNRISSISHGVVSPVVDLASPGAIEIASDGTIYATTGVFGPAGSVVIVTP